MSSRPSSTRRRAPISAFGSTETSSVCVPRAPRPRRSPPSRVFEIIPAIDLRGGRCVRLVHGDFDRQTVYGDDPAAMARRWVEAGARRLHVVDLDGSKAGRPLQLPVVEQIVSAIGVPVQM